jgi:tetratricopeptide (TPR) repeat protein
MTSVLSLYPLRFEVGQVIASWREGTTPPDARAVLEDQPEILSDPFLVLELAHAEYEIRRLRGEPIDPLEFCARFPEVASLLRDAVAVNAYFESHAGTLDESGKGAYPAVGDQLGRYRILRQLGRGSYARVYLATDANTGGRPVVLKLSERAGLDAQIAGPLAHPHIVPILDAVQEPTTGLYLVCMPYQGLATLADVLEEAFPARKMGAGQESQADPSGPQQRGGAPINPALRDGASLIAKVARVRRAPEEDLAGAWAPEAWARAPHPLLRTGTFTEGVLHLGCQIAQALAALHQKGVCHHDLKPSNVLLGFDGRAYLLDFNLSGPATMQDGRAAGSIPYMPPEQLRCLLLGPDPAESAPSPSCVPGVAADVYALGVLLYELLTGSHPFGTDVYVFDGDTQASLLLWRHKSSPIPLRELNPQVDDRIAEVITLCLATDPARRPADVREVLEALEAYFRFPRPTVRRIVRLACHRLIIAAAVLLLAGSALAYLAVPLGADDPVKTAVAAAQVGRYADAEDSFTRALAEAPQDRELLCGRGWVRLRQSYAIPAGALRQAKVDEAAQDFRDALGDDPDGPTLASLAYSRLLQGNNVSARIFSEEAEKKGYINAAMLNNRAWSRINSSPQWGQMMAELDRALELDPNLQAAYLNRALCRIQLTWDHPIPPDSIADIEKAIALGKDTDTRAELFVLAAKFHAYAAVHDRAGRQAHLEKAIDHLLRAIDLGQDLRLFCGQLLPPPRDLLQAHPRWREVTKRQRGERRPARNLHFAEPVSQPFARSS